METPQDQLDAFIAKFTPEIAARTREALAKMRDRLPGAVELVYDNYNALAIGFGPTERMSDILFSIAVYPRWISLFIMGGQILPDPEGLLKGSGNTVRHIVLDTPDLLESPGVQRLIALTLERESSPIDAAQPGRIVIKSISAKQRPRRPK